VYEFYLSLFLLTSNLSLVRSQSAQFQKFEIDNQLEQKAVKKCVKSVCCSNDTVNFFITQLKISGNDTLLVDNIVYGDTILALQWNFETNKSSDTVNAEIWFGNELNFPVSAFRITITDTSFFSEFIISTDCLDCEGYPYFKLNLIDSASATIAVQATQRKLFLSHIQPATHLKNNKIVYGYAELKSESFYDAENNKYTIERQQYFSIVPW
jgi:hypothetical protein